MTAADRYDGPRTPVGRSGPAPRTLLPRDLADAGYQAASEHPQVEHAVVFWSPEHECPEVLDGFTGGDGSNWRRIAGPATPAEEPVR